MAKKLDNKKLVDDNILIPLLDRLEEAVKKIGEMDDALKDVLKTQEKLAKSTPLDSYEGLQKVEKGIKDVEKASEGLSKNEKDRLRLLKQLTDLTEEQSLANEELRQKANELRKGQRALAKENIGLTDEYQRQSKELNKARKQYKSLFLETEKNRKGLKGLVFQFTKAGKELSFLKKGVIAGDKALKALDKTVGQNQREVGNYEKATKKLNSTLTKLGVAALALKALDGIKASFQANSTSAAIFDKVAGALSATIGVLVNTLVTAGPALISIISSFANEIRVAFLEVKLFAEELKNTFGTGDTKRIKELKDSISDLNNEIENNKGFDDLSKAFEGFFDNVEKAVKASNALVDATQKSRLAVIALNNTLSKEADSIKSLSDEVKAITKDNESLLEAEVRLEEQSESNFIALQERANATKQLLIIRAAISEQNVQIAKEERNLALQRVRLTEIGSKDGAKNIEAREQLAQAERALTDAQVQATKDRVMSEREARDIETDLIERNLDFIIDDFDRRKSVNEKLVADETQTFAKRRALAVENRRLAEKSFRDSVEEINKGIEAGKEKLDFDKLVALEDSKLIAQAIENSGLNDKLAARALEIIKERVAFNQELFESERDLIRARQEGREVEEEILFLAERLEIIRTNRGKAVKELEELEDRIAQNTLMRINEEIEAIRKRREVEREALRGKIEALEGSTSEEDKIAKASYERRLQALTGLSKEELDLLKEKAETEISIEEKKNAKIIEQRVKLQETLSELTDAFFDARFERQNEQLDRQLEAEKTRTSELRELAKNNVEGATENLALQQKREAEIERDRERLRKRQAKEKAFLTLLDTASAKAAAGDENAIVNTIFDAQVLKAFVQTLPSFYDGTESLGKVANPLDSNGGRVILAHDNERIMPKVLNESLEGAPSNEMLASTYNLGRMILDSGMPKSASTTKVVNDDRVLSKLDDVRQAIESKPVHTGIDYDKVTNLVSDRLEQKNRVVNNYRKAVRKH